MVKKFRGGAVRAEPIVPTEQVVNSGGDHLNPRTRLLAAQFLDEIGRLLLCTFPRQHHPIPYGQADRVKASLTRSSDEIERFQRESFPFPSQDDSIAYC